MFETQTSQGRSRVESAMRGRPQNRLRQVQGVCKKMKECNPVLKNEAGDQILSEVDVGCHHQQPKYSIEKKKLGIRGKVRPAAAAIKVPEMRFSLRNECTIFSKTFPKRMQRSWDSIKSTHVRNG